MCVWVHAWIVVCVYVVFVFLVIDRFIWFLNLHWSLQILCLGHCFTAAEPLEMEPTSGAREYDRDCSNSSSYTSVYTWTTATGTVTNTAQMGTSACYIMQFFLTLVCNRVADWIKTLTLMFSRMLLMLSLSIHVRLLHWAHLPAIAGSEVTAKSKGGNLDSSSPTLVLKSYLQEHLHSTAINPQLDICRLEQTPQVSPIKFLSGQRIAIQGGVAEWWR